MALEINTQAIKESKFTLQLSAEYMSLKKDLEVLKKLDKNDPRASSQVIAWKEARMREIEYRLKWHNFWDLEKQIDEFFKQNPQLDRTKIQIETKNMLNKDMLYDWYEVSEFPHLLLVYPIMKQEINTISVDALKYEKMWDELKKALKWTTFDASKIDRDNLPKVAADLWKIDWAKIPVDIKDVIVSSDGTVTIKTKVWNEFWTSSHNEVEVVLTKVDVSSSTVDVSKIKPTLETELARKWNEQLKSWKKEEKKADKTETLDKEKSDKIKEMLSGVKIPTDRIPKDIPNDKLLKWYKDFDKSDLEARKLPVQINWVTIKNLSVVNWNVVVNFDFDDAFINEPYNKWIEVTLDGVDINKLDKDKLREQFIEKVATDWVRKSIAKMDGKVDLQTEVKENPKVIEMKKTLTSVLQKLDSNVWIEVQMKEWKNYVISNVFEKKWDKYFLSINDKNQITLFKEDKNDNKFKNILENKSETDILKYFGITERKEADKPNDKLLSSYKIKKAINYNKSQKYSETEIKQIQEKVWINPQTWTIDEAFVLAVAKYQQVNKLTIDWKVWSDTLKALKLDFSQTNKKDKSKSDTAKAKEKASEQQKLPDYAKRLEDNLKEYPIKTIEELKGFTWKATVVYKDFVYQWEFKEWNLEWKATAIYDNWDKFAWDFKNDKREWQWKYTWKNGIEFNWEWKNNERYSWEQKDKNGNLTFIYKDWKAYEVKLSNAEFTKTFPEKAIALLNKEAWTSFVYDATLTQPEAFYTKNLNINWVNGYSIRIWRTDWNISLMFSWQNSPIETWANKVIAKLKELTK